MFSFQLTNQPISETTQIFLKALTLSFSDSFTILSQGLPLTADNLPTGSIDIGTHNKLPLFARKKSDLPTTLERIPTNSLIMLTDWFSPLLFSTKDHKEYRLIHLITDLLPADVHQQLKKFYQKQKNPPIIVAASKTIAESLVSFTENEIQVVYPPYLKTDYLPDVKEKQSFVVGVAAPLEKQQGLETLIQALNRNKEVLPQLTVILIGDGTERKQLHWLVDHLHLRKRIQFMSTMEHYHRFLPNFDVVVVPDQVAKGWNQVIAHAFANGIPVVASKIGVNEEIIEHGQSGLLFEPGNSHMLAQHLLNLYNHPEWMGYYKEKGPQLVRNLFMLSYFAALSVWR